MLSVSRTRSHFQHWQRCSGPRLSVRQPSLNSKTDEDCQRQQTNFALGRFGPPSTTINDHIASYNSRRLSHVCLSDRRVSACTIRICTGHHGSPHRRGCGCHCRYGLLLYRFRHWHHSRRNVNVNCRRFFASAVIVVAFINSLRLCHRLLILASSRDITSACHSLRAASQLTGIIPSTRLARGAAV